VPDDHALSFPTARATALPEADLLSALGTEADAIWGACQGWPGTGDRQGASSYLRRHRRDAQFLLAGYPGEVTEIRRRLADRDRLVAFVKRAQDLPPDQLRTAFLSAFAPDR